MTRLGSPADLEELRRSILSGRDPKRRLLTLCKGTGCGAYGSARVAEALREQIKKHGLGDAVGLVVTGCHGFCEKGPILVIRPEDIFYHGVKPEDAAEIIGETMVHNRIVERLLYRDPNTGETVVHEHDIPFYKHQTRVVFGNNGRLDPTRIEDYIAIGGYSALARALAMRPEQIIDEVKRAGLRGRGGAGFSTGQKWELCRRSPGDQKYIICNADEGDPGAYMDRSLLEGNPHSVLEGMIIGAHAMGASEGYVYVRTEYPLAIVHLTYAIAQLEERGLLGEDLLGSGFGLRLRIFRGAGAFVCGEETALMASIESKVGEPRGKPPYPAQSGLWGKPTNINNVKTWANVPLIINRGADWFGSIGTNTSKGTMVFSLVGKINNTGLVEVPMGITLRKMIYEIGGGVPKGKRFKAVQTGGPSGGCIPPDLLDLQVDYDQLTAAGAMMGSGGMIVMDEDTCMVDIAKYFLNFLKDESCGKCTPCRVGVTQMHSILTDITEGRGRLEDLDLLSDLAEVVRNGSLCLLGGTSANPVQTTLKYFRDEYLAHIVEKRCPAGVCKEIVSSPCQHACPIGTEAQGYISLIARQRYREAYEIIRKDNPLPSVCGRVCHHPCETKCSAGKHADPISIRALKRFATDQARAGGFDYKPARTPTAPAGGEKVAVVGAGPAGLSCAYFLALRGYRPTVFEKLPVAGGALAVCIPEYRLPKKILESDLQSIRDAGVEIRTGVTVGKDLTLEELRREYSAVFIGAGAHRSIRLGIPGEDAEGVMDGMEFLKDLSLGKRASFGRRLAVIGGGNAAVDAARMARRLRGCERTTLFYRRTRAEMPAFKDEVDAAIEEGIEMVYLSAPRRIITEDGRVTGLECVRMELGEPDASGRRRPVPVAGSEFTTELDTVIVAIGERADVLAMCGGSGVALDDRGTVKVDGRTLATSVPGIFAGGDVATGPATVIDAMGAGKVAAEMIDRYINGRPVEREYRVSRPSVYVGPVELSEEEVSQSRRPAMPCVESCVCTTSLVEVETGLTEEMAVREARRCLRCDLETNDGKAAIKGREGA
ncbi:MAG: FAD-binding protein [Euryarchaeota archaeon]|nr:FAD-binding protein [Euryarchaeota archaeon]